MPEAFIGIGSNIDRERNIEAGLSRLRARFGAVRASPVWNAQAVGFEGDDFLNLVAAIETDLPPHDLVRELHAIEAECGRDRALEGGMRSRSLDLDLLLYGDAVIVEEGLELPRDEILQHAYVLAPLSALAPDLRHPVDGRTYAELWRDFSGDRTTIERITSR